MNACKAHPLEHLADYVAGRLRGEEAAAMARHVAECDTCRRAADRLRRLHEAMIRSDAFAERHVAGTDHARLMSEVARLATEAGRAGVIRRWFTRASLLRLAATAAAAAVIIAGAIFLELASRSPQGATVATVAAARGTIRLDGEPATLSADAALRAGDHLRTGPDARLTIDITTGGRLELNENTSLDLGAARDRQAVCRLAEGELFATVPAAEEGQPPVSMAIRTPVGTAETSGAAFDLKVIPRSAASAWLPVAPLAFQGGEVLGHVGAMAEVQITVLAGEVLFRDAVGTVTTLTADMHMRYDPATVRPDVTTGDPRRYVLWRLSDDEIVAMARPQLSELFAARLVSPLPDGRLRLDYDFLSSAELEHDWSWTGNQWRLHRNYLRLRQGEGETLSAPSEILSRAAFLGEPEVTFEATVDPVRTSRLGWAFLYARSDEGGVPVAGRAEITFNGRGRIDMHLDVEGRPEKSESAPSPGPALSFGGRIEDGTAIVLLSTPQQEPEAVMAEAVPDAVLRRLHRAENPDAVRVAIRAAGPDVIINHITIIARPDPRWLRKALADLFQRQSPYGW